MPLEEVVEHTMNCEGLPGLALVVLRCEGIVLCDLAGNCCSVWGLSGECAAAFQGILEKVWRGADLEPEICIEKSTETVIKH